MTGDDLVALRLQLVAHEGERLRPYLDVTGHVSIGVGRNLTDKGISQTESRILLDNDIGDCIRELCATFQWFPDLDGPRQRVLVDMCFNLGIDGLQEFKKFLGYVANQQYASAAREMLNSKWAAQVGARAQRLAALMLSGQD